MNEHYFNKFAFIGLMALVGGLGGMALEPPTPKYEGYGRRCKLRLGSYTYPRGYRAKKRRKRRLAEASRRRNRC